MIVDGRYRDYQKVLACADYRGNKSKRVIKGIGKLCACRKTVNGCFKSRFDVCKYDIILMENMMM